VGHYSNKCDEEQTVKWNKKEANFSSLNGDKNNYHLDEEYDTSMAGLYAFDNTKLVVVE